MHAGEWSGSAAARVCRYWRGYVIRGGRTRSVSAEVKSRPVLKARLASGLRKERVPEFDRPKPAQPMHVLAHARIVACRLPQAPLLATAGTYHLFVSCFQ